jgi:hypothetical protein
MSAHTCGECARDPLAGVRETKYCRAHELGLIGEPFSSGGLLFSF